MRSALHPIRLRKGKAASAFREAMQNAHESKPERIFTDAHKSYKDGIKIDFRTGQTSTYRQGGDG